VPHVVSRSRVAAAVRAALEAAGAPAPASIGVVLSADSELAQLNAVHMGVSGATDVLSFPFFPPEAFPSHERGVSNQRDAVGGRGSQAGLCPPARAASSPRRHHRVRGAGHRSGRDGRGGQTGDVRWTAAEELLLLTVHGTLHVCGWDHAEPVEEAAMRALERRVLASLAAPGHEHAGEADHGPATEAAD
jgi:probable rRNA maturation factor